MSVQNFAPAPRANAILEKLCPYHYPYVSKCQTCRAFLHKVSKELFAQESEKVKSQAEISKLLKQNVENEKLLHQKDLQMQVLADKLKYQENVHLIPGTDVEWMVHAIASRMNKRLKITPQLLANDETKDCQVDFEGFDKEKLTNSNATKTIVNDQCKSKFNQPKQQLNFPRKKTTSYVPCGTESLFNEIPTSVTASLGLTATRGGRGAFRRNSRRGYQRYPRHSGFKRGSSRGHFNQTDMTRFLDDYFAYKKGNESVEADDHESVHSYTTEDQEHSNIALPLGSVKKGKSVMHKESDTAATSSGTTAKATHGFTREEIENMDMEDELGDYEDQEHFQTETAMNSANSTTTNN